MDVDWVDDLDDENLYNHLREYRQHLGPVVETTRSLYRTLLKKALVEGSPKLSEIAGTGDVVEPLQESPTVELRSRKSPRRRSRKSSPIVDEVNDEDEEDEEFEVISPDEVAAVKETDYEGGEWVQNDPHEVAPAFSFFVRAFLFGLGLSALAIFIIYTWTSQNQ